MWIELQITGALGVLLLVHCLAWPRRDNVIAYVQAGAWLTSAIVPVFLTDVLDSYDQGVVERFADLLTLGAIGYATGVLAGTLVGRRLRVSWPLTFDRPLAPSTFRFIRGRARLLGLLAALALLAAFVLMGFAPMLAADRVSAKYGVGPYAAGFARGGPIYLFGLALGAAIAPVLLIAWWRRRTAVDFLLVLSLLSLLLLSLSRYSALSGFLLVVPAILLAWGRRPAVIAVVVVSGYVLGATFNSVFFDSGPEADDSVAEQLMRSSPDLPDALLFLDAYETRGGRPTNGQTIIAALGFGRAEYDTRSYTLGMITGADDVSGFPSGGLRLPAPIWGLTAFGEAGAFSFSLVSGALAAVGMSLLRRVVPARDPVALVVASTFYLGTFGSLATFYAPASSMFVLLAAALLVGVHARYRVYAP